MKLKKLLAGEDLSLSPDLEEIEITSIEEDSRLAVPGTLFVALKGFNTDGHRYIGNALESVAAAVLSAEGPSEDGRVIFNPSGNNRPILGRLAAVFYDFPWRRLKTVGVTGTNGKTSTVRMLRWILESQGISTGLMGTVGHIVGGGNVPASMTTPGSLETTRMMSRMVQAGDGSCVMEVSSHALALSRVDMVEYDVALFTNISQDHLDYHSDMDDYLRAKLHLFDLIKDGGSALVGTYAPGFPNVKDARTFGPGPEDDYRITDIHTGLEGTEFVFSTGKFQDRVKLSVPGRFNAMNAAGALAAAAEAGLDLAGAVDSLKDFSGVPGRFEPVNRGQGFLVAVDYAHTPDALERVLQQARELAQGRVIAVFGAGGDRDSKKRPLMGGIARRLADLLIITSDNPRTENPGSIIDDILAGTGHDGEMIVEPDRRRAIGLAISSARDGDVVIIAGKGHEDYQIIGREKIHFDDREEAARALEGSCQ